MASESRGSVIRSAEDNPPTRESVTGETEQDYDQVLYGDGDPAEVEMSAEEMNSALMAMELPGEDDPGVVEEETVDGIRQNIQSIIEENQAEFEKRKKQPSIKLDELSSRDFIQKSVVPIITQGLEALAKERPPEPIEFLAAYLIKNKEHYKKY